MLDDFARRLDVSWDEIRTDRLVKQIHAPVMVVHDDEDPRDVLVDAGVMRGVIGALTSPESEVGAA